jgi:hypothetical protein
MLDRMIHSGGIVVCEERYLVAMRELQAEADTGQTTERYGGHCIPILPMKPDEQKFARVKFCEACVLIIVAKSDQIPSAEIPAFAK